MSDEPVPLTTHFPNLKPGKRPGALGAVNGFGTTLVGRRDFDPETGTYVVTHVVTALFVPVWALAAYRVADAQGGGWYCLGREPLSRTARTCNALLALVIAAAIGGIWWNSHTKSPEYMAGRKLKQADEAAAAGRGGEAARLCREVMDSQTAKADEARQKLAGFIENPPGAPGEAAAVYEVAVDLHRNSRCPVADLFDKGKALAVRYADGDPAAALALLEVIAPYAPDVNAELAVRRELLERLLARSPGDAEAASRLATVYEQQGERDRCEQLLAPMESRLGTLDGAAVLGRIYAARGDHDKAHALLAPYVAARLPAYLAAEREYVSQTNAAEESVVKELKEDRAPGFDMARARKAQKAEQQSMVNAYINERLKNDPALRAARRKLVAERGAVGAALDLGVVQIQRAQTMADPAARRAELEAAEKTFLSIAAVAGRSDEYRLSLGQVYYWLGRPADGKKQFDDLLASKNRATASVLAVARVLREIGEVTAARQMVEEAYGRETDQAQKQAAAHFRALVHNDLDDDILWLSRSDPNASEVQASLAMARGHKAEQDGKDDEAANQYRQAIAAYTRLPENAATLNNSALAHFALYQVTLDRDEFARGMDKLDRSIALDPKSSISLLNGASVLVEAAARDTVGKEIDFRPLKSSSVWDAVGYLYRTPAEREVVRDRFARHPGVVKARAYVEKLLVLAPKRDSGYLLLYALCEQTDDLEGLKAVAARTAKADFDLGDRTRKYKEFLAGQSDARRIEEARSSVARAEAALSASRPVGGRTYALAVGRYVQAKTAGWVYGLPADPDELVKLADEVHATPSSGTESTLHTALTFRAHVTLIRENPTYAAQAERTKRSFGVGLVNYVLSGGGPVRDAAAKNADVRRIAELAVGSFGRYPDRATAGEWVTLRAVGSEAAQAVAEKARANAREQARREIGRATAPYSAETALEEYRCLLLTGKTAEANKVLAELAARGVPVP